MVDKYNLNLTGYPLFRLENLSDSGINLGDLTIAICILITVYFQKLLGLVRVSFGEHFIITALAVPVAIINLYSSGDTWLVSSSTPRDIIAMLVPLTIFVSVFNADLHILHQCLPQVLLLNTIGVSVFVLLFGFAMSCACLREIRWDYILCYGMAMVSSDSRILLKVLRTIDIQSTTLALLLSECVTTFANSLIIIDIYMGYADGTVTTIYQIVFIHSRMTFLGLLVGCSSGKLCTLVINPKIHNHKYLIMTWIIMAYIMYIICEGFMFCSGSLAVLSFAIFMSTEKNRVAVSSQILKWLPFFESMSGFEALYNAAVELEYEPESLILTKGKLSEGIYIVIDGLASMKLSMDEKVRARVKQYGALPVKDYLCDVDYYHASDHYVISGNSMGILSFLTNRPCDYDVRAIVKTRVFFLNATALNMAMNSNSDPVHGLRSRLWKYVSVNLALSIMWRVPIYRNLRVEETYYYMEKSFVPNVSSKESICISEDVEDLILIEGRIRDKYSLKIYVAPCYVPRSVRKMQFIRNPRLLIEPQLFIIPFKPELHVKIYEFLDTFRPTPMFVEEPLQNRQSIFSRSAFNKRLNFSNIISPNVSYKKYARMPPRSSKNESIHTLLEDTDLNK